MPTGSGDTRMPRKPLQFQTTEEDLDVLTRASQGRGKKGSVPKEALARLINDHSLAVGRLSPYDYQNPEDQ